MHWWSVGSRAPVIEQCLVLALVAGCQQSPRTAADFEGHGRAARVQAEQVQVEPALPLGYERLGRVSAHCDLDRSEQIWKDKWLSDIACSHELLVEALRERAAAEGGDLLAGVECRTRQVRRLAWRLHCEAEVGRAGETIAALSMPPGQAEARSFSGLPPHQAWNIRVDYTPARNLPEGVSRTSEQAREFAELPVGYLVLGELVVSCASGCSEEGARTGLMVAAARRGATAVVRASCVAHRAGWLCTGIAAVKGPWGGSVQVAPRRW